MLSASGWLAGPRFSTLPIVLAELDTDRLGLPSKGTKQRVKRSQFSTDGAEQTDGMIKPTGYKRRTHGTAIYYTERRQSLQTYDVIHTW